MFTFDSSNKCSAVGTPLRACGHEAIFPCNSAFVHPARQEVDHQDRQAHRQQRQPYRDRPAPTSGPELHPVQSGPDQEADRPIREAKWWQIQCSEGYITCTNWPRELAD